MPKKQPGTTDESEVKLISPIRHKIKEKKKRKTKSQKKKRENVVSAQATLRSTNHTLTRASGSDIVLVFHADMIRSDVFVNKKETPERQSKKRFAITKSAL